MDITIDYKNICGEIKPMHGVNNAPFVPKDYGNPGLFQKMKEAGIPFSRLHDTGGDWGGAHYVDIANVFPDFNADPEKIESYDFAFTDRLMEELVKYGMEPFYRLGCSIENLQYIKAYNIYPPKDNLKWARICEGIIKHYNRGWGTDFITISAIGRSGMSLTTCLIRKKIPCGRGRWNSISPCMKRHPAI